jgi:uncharacterized membrane protein
VENLITASHPGKVPDCAPSREARKAELLHVFNTWRMQRLATFADSLSPEDAEILLEGYQEQLEKEIGV